MPNSRETVFAALHARLSALPATALRGEVLPERLPDVGLLTLRDGEPGEPEVTLSPLRFQSRKRLAVRYQRLSAECLVLGFGVPAPYAGVGRFAPGRCLA